MRVMCRREVLQKVTSKMRTRVSEVSARTQVYLSKTKLESTSEYLAVYIVKVQIGVRGDNKVKCERCES